MVTKLLKHFRKDETGAAMVEYAIALLVAAGIGVGVFSAMGDKAGSNAYKACIALHGEEATECGTDPLAATTD